MNRRAALGVLLAAGLVPRRAFARDLDVPYVPTPQVAVEAMLALAKVGRDDYLIDLGCGDGRIPITAARDFGTRGLGVDLDPVRIAQARANALAAQVADRVEFRRADLFVTDIAPATVLTLYLLPEVNLRLRPTILARLAPGSRVVSHGFDMGDWPPDRSIVAEGSRLHLWVVPAAVDGLWRVTTPDGRDRHLALAQTFQTAAVAGHPPARLDGRRIALMIDGVRLEGLIEGQTMRGPGWTAVRIADRGG